MSKLTPQEIINKVGNHLLDQSNCSERDGRCAYRGEGGAMCAAGCLIPDGFYLPNMEGRNWFTLTLWFPKIKAMTSESGHRLIELLQKMHDQNPPESWEETIHEIASTFSEEYPEEPIQFTRITK